MSLESAINELTAALKEHTAAAKALLEAQTTVFRTWTATSKETLAPEPEKPKAGKKEKTPEPKPEPAAEEPQAEEPATEDPTEPEASDEDAPAITADQVLDYIRGRFKAIRDDEGDEALDAAKAKVTAVMKEVNVSKVVEISKFDAAGIADFDARVRKVLG